MMINKHSGWVREKGYICFIRMIYFLTNTQKIEAAQFNKKHSIWHLPAWGIEPHFFIYEMKAKEPTSQYG